MAKRADKQDAGREGKGSSKAGISHTGPSKSARVGVGGELASTAIEDDDFDKVEDDAMGKQEEDGHGNGLEASPTGALAFGIDTKPGGAEEFISNSSSESEDPDLTNNPDLDGAPAYFRAALKIQLDQNKKVSKKAAKRIQRHTDKKIVDIEKEITATNKVVENVVKEQVKAAERIQDMTRASEDVLEELKQAKKRLDLIEKQQMEAAAGVCGPGARAL